MKTKEHKQKCPRCNRELELDEELDCGPDPYSSAVLGDFSDTAQCVRCYQNSKDSI